MKTVHLLFPGQGSQYVGMGKNLPSSHLFKKAKEVLDFDLEDLCFNGPEEKLKLTEYTQPAILTHSLVLFENLLPILEKNSIEIGKVLGHSVGEYPALVAAGSLRFEDAVKAVNLRGKYMQEAVAPGQGKMYAVLRVPGDIVAKACEAVSTETEKVMCANFNDPTQVVISGHAKAADLAVAWLKENYEGKQMAKELAVSAPFHSSLMQPAAEKLASFFKTIEFSENKYDYIANIDAKNYPIKTAPQIIQQNLEDQVCGSVLWNQSMQSFSDNSVFIEVGPGKVLTGLNKRINSTFKTFNLDQENGFDKIEDFLNDN